MLFPSQTDNFWSWKQLEIKIEMLNHKTIRISKKPLQEGRRVQPTRKLSAPAHGPQCQLTPTAMFNDVLQWFLDAEKMHAMEATATPNHSTCKTKWRKLQTVVKISTLTSVHYTVLIHTHIHTRVHTSNCLTNQHHSYNSCNLPCNVGCRCLLQKVPLRQHCINCCLSAAA